MTAPATLPLVSVIVPSRNRRELLRATLESLLAQDYPAERTELIVVDNRSRDGTAEMVAELAARAGREIRFALGPDRGPAPSRNLGARLALGEILAFTDSDCIPAPGWLAAAVAAFQAGERVGLVCGPVGMPGVRDPLADLPLRAKGLWIDRENPFYPTANVLYTREAFWAEGGFPEDYPPQFLGELQGGDDVELAWRVKRTGRACVFAPAARVEHAIHLVSWRRWLRTTLYFYPLGTIVRRCPEVRRSLPWRVFLPWMGAPRFKLLLLGLLLAPLTPLALLLTVPFYHFWARAYAPDLRRPRRWPLLLGRLAAVTFYNLVLTVVLLASSLRARSLVL